MTRAGFVPFAWYRIVVGLVSLRGTGRRVGVVGGGPGLWLRRRFITGFFVTVPLVVSVVAIVWVFGWADRLTGGLSERVLGSTCRVSASWRRPLFVLIVGIVATNVIGRRFLERAEQLLLHVPLFRTVYAPVKQLISAFSPDNEFGFKRMVLVDNGSRGFALGFLTKEFSVDRGRGPEALVAVYMPTNHLYLGDVVVCRLIRCRSLT